MVEKSVINLMMELITLSFVVPVVLIAVWKMRNRKSLIPVFAGAGVYLLFAMIFKSVPDMLFLNLVGRNIWLQILYTAVVTALLEGAGMYFAFRWFLAKYGERETAISFGLGYACLDCMITLGVTNIQNHAFAQMINRKQMDALLESVASNPAASATYQALAERLTKLGRMDLLLEGIQQLIFLFLHAALAVLVFYAVRKAGQIRYLWISMAMQALLLFLPAFYKSGLVPELVVLLCLLILTAGVVQLAYRLYKSLPKQGETVSKDRSGWNYAGKKLGADQNGELHESK